MDLLAPAPEVFDLVEVGPYPVSELPVGRLWAKGGPILYSLALSRGKDGIVTIF